MGAIMKKRVFIGLKEIAGGASQLCLGFRELGHTCDFFSFQKHKFKYREPTNSILMRLIQAAYDKWSKAWEARKEPARVFWKYTTKALLALLLVGGLLKYDIFIFFFNTTFSKRQLDLPILKFFGKKTVFIYCGSDSRPPYLSGRYVDLADTPEGVDQLAEMTRLQKLKIIRAEKYADHLIDIPPQALFHERKYISFEAIGKPGLVPAIPPADRRDGAQTVIVHSPSNPKTKGTERVREIIAELKAEGYLIKYVELVGETNETVLRWLAECDLVIDQIWSDTPMAGLATEAAFRGKPTVVGGYYADFVKDELPDYLIAPTLFVHPDKVKEAVERLLNDPELRLELGARAKDFVEKNYKASLSAQKILAG